MVAREQLITAEALLDMPEVSARVELVRGELVEMPPTGEAHGITSLWIGHLLISYVEAHDLGEVFAAETGFILARDPDTVRGLDAAFVAKARLTGPTSQGFFPGPPDLAVEVVSPNDRADKIHDKVLEYLEAGTRLVWVVYPDRKSVMVYSPDADARVLGLDDTLDGGDVLPGLKLPVHDVFKRLRG